MISNNNQGHNNNINSNNNNNTKNNSNIKTNSTVVLGASEKYLLTTNIYNEISYSNDINKKATITTTTTTVASGNVN